MNRSALLLLVAALLAQSGSAGASVAPVFLPRSEPSDYERVDAAVAIVLARLAEAMEGELRFEVEEVLKGEAGKTLQVRENLDALPEGPWCVIQRNGCYKEDGLYLLFLDREGLRAQQPEPDDDWRRTVSLFTGISALDDPEREKEALRELRKAAQEDREGLYPEGLVRRIDRHFAVPSPGKSFSDLMNLYYGAELADDRLAVIRALYHGGHPETPGFFRGLLFAGEPAELLDPLTTWFRGDHEDELPPIKDLARIYLSYPPGERGPVLQLILDSAEPKDGPLLWSLLPGSKRREMQLLVQRVLDPFRSHQGLAGLTLPPDERLRRDLIAVWLRLSEKDGKYRLGELLREQGAWNDTAIPAELASAFEAAKDPSVRRQILLELFQRARAADLPIVWRLLRRAEGWEADLLLEWVAAHPPSWEDRAALYRGATTEDERIRALWVAAAAEVSEHPLSGIGSLGITPSRLVRVFVTSPNELVRSAIAWQLASSATPGDLRAMLDLLRDASVEEIRFVAHWFARHPSPEALSDLRRAFPPIPQGDFWTSGALAAAGDPEILDLALKVLRSPGRDDDPWAMSILARSPLPAAAMEARRILAGGGDPLLGEIVRSGTVDEGERERARWLLQQAASSELPQP